VQDHCPGGDLLTVLLGHNQLDAEKCRFYASEIVSDSFKSEVVSDGAYSRQG
jgi:hypothetical protein